MKPLLTLLSALMLATLSLGQPGQAADRAGDFDYYVLSLSWAPSWCNTANDTRDSNSCDPGRKTGFVVHGLWPQFENGWPSDCQTSAPGPTRQDTRAMRDLMGSSGLAWYQWRKHGRCSGLASRDYFALMREAASRITTPEVLTKLPRTVSLPAKVVEEAFIEANPQLSEKSITVTCKGEHFQEVRICLAKDLSPRACAPDASRDCTRKVLLPAPR